MRVLWITPGYPWKGDTVAFSFHRSQALALAAEGVDLQVIAPTPWVPPLVTHWKPHLRRYMEMPVRQADGSVTVSRPRYPTTPRENHLGVAHALQAMAVWRTAPTQPDIVHAHFAYPSGAAALLLKRRWGVPFALTLHGDDVTIYPHRSQRMMVLFRETLQGADSVMAVSPALAAQAETLSGRSVDVLSTGVDLTVFGRPGSGEDRVAARLAARTQFDLPQGAFIILFVGNLLPQKGVNDLLAAFRLLDWPDALTVFAGTGPVLLDAPRVRLLGARPHSEIPTLLSAADLLVLPSWHEGLGQAAVEAGAAGVPVVGSAVGGLANLLAEDRGFLVPPRRPMELAEALARVRAYPEEARQRAARLQAHVRVVHDLHANARRLAALYRSEIQRAGGNAR